MIIYIGAEKLKKEKIRFSRNAVIKNIPDTARIIVVVLGKSFEMLMVEIIVNARKTKLLAHNNNLFSQLWKL
jgi:hypothetical protein